MTIAPTAIGACAQCATQLAPTAIACPRCGRLVYTERLESLAQSARDSTERGDLSNALSLWREALVLLPAGSKQHQIISAKITELGARVPLLTSPVEKPAESSKPRSAWAATIAAIGLMFWKLKTLLFGLSKGTTLLSMLLSLGVYWSLWGWKFALGIVLSIYVHEMGHVIALRRYGFKATAPMFIPGLGALIRLQQQVVNSREDAEIGLAGPIYGLGAALASIGLWFITHHQIFAAIAGVGAWINLFNLLPISTLDGGRGFHAMSRLQKVLATATVAGAWYLSRDGLLVLLAIVCLGRALGDKSEKDGNWKAAITYIVLVIALTAVSLMRLHVEHP